MSTGERLPLLVEVATGVPLFDPTVYALTVIRAANRASNTIERHLRAIMQFQIFLDCRGICMAERLRQGRLLDISEMDELTRNCRLHLDDMLDLAPVEPARRSPPKVFSLETFRMKQGAVRQHEVDSATSSSRLRAIRDYIDWLAQRRLLTLPINSNEHQALKSTRDRVCTALSARAPSHRDMNTVNLREGLPTDEKQLLLEVISPESPDNPWKSPFSRCRNQVAILLMYQLGLRRGEVLGIKVADIDFRQQTVTIRRRADDPEDPRAEQPNTKTLGRMIALPPRLCALLEQYILRARRMLPGARTHNFLIVADRTGAPMTLSAVNKTFEVLRSRVAGLSKTLSPHVLRHCFNDNFSERADRQGISPQEEMATRQDVMGWKNEKTARTYLRRHSREKAREALLDMQEALTNGVPRKKMNVERDDDEV